MSAEQERFQCALCDFERDRPDDLAEIETGVCYRCAEVVANHWWRARSGDWLTWPNLFGELVALIFRARSGDWLTWPNPPREPKPAPRRGKVSASRRLRAYERDGFKCVYCKSGKGLTIDHVVPLSKGGTHDIGNLVTSCLKCNISKAAKPLAQFWGERQ